MGDGPRPFQIQRDALLHRLRLQSDRNFLHRTDSDSHVRIGLRESVGLYFYLVSSRRQIVDPELAARVAGDFTLE